MKLIEGNILDTELKHIAHGCNAQGAFNSGVAKAIRDKYPQCFITYSTILKEIAGTYENPMGSNIEYYDAMSGVTIHNVITQYFYGYEKLKYARYLAVVEGLSLALDRSYGELAIPRIGCGRGGLKWDIVRELLEEVEDKLHKEFWVYHIKDEYSEE